MASFTGQFGVNIPLGGLGNINPFSGATITADGRFGHLFLYYKSPTAEKNGAMLIGSEASGPSDHDVSHVGTKDQYGGSHGLGGSTTYEATGAKRWKDQTWHGRGPTGSYDFMFIDLSTGWNFLQTPNFDKDILGRYGNLPQVAVIPTLMSLKEWKKRRYVFGKANQTLKTLDTAVEAYHNATLVREKRALLLTIIAFCDEYISTKLGRKEGHHPRVRAAEALKKEAGSVLGLL